MMIGHVSERPHRRSTSPAGLVARMLAFHLHGIISTHRKTQEIADSTVQASSRFPYSGSITKEDIGRLEYDNMHYKEIA
jgi:hypothetical protein